MSLDRVGSVATGVDTSRHIPRRTLPLEIAMRLRQLIMDGDLKGGERLSEIALSAQFGVSRTPLREALKVLATEGLIELLPNRGAVIARLTSEELDHMFPVMEVLEGLAGELACTNITEPELEEIQALHGKMIESYKKRRRREYFELNRLIHEKIIAAARNPVLSTVYSNLSAKIRRARYMPNISDETWKIAAKDHELIMKALTARDGARLNQILKDHLGHKRDGVKAAWAKYADS